MRRFSFRRIVPSSKRKLMHKFVYKFVQYNIRPCSSTSTISNIFGKSSTSESKYKCFPISDIFESKFKESYPATNIYEADKMWPTIDKWLSGRCCISYKPVLLYAEHDYMEHVKKIGNSKLTMLAKLDLENRLERVNTVLSDIAKNSDVDIYNIEK